jgi:hypothetical protein
VAQAPPVIDALFGRALAKAPDDRFTDALDMGDAFRTALGIPASPFWLALTDLARAAGSTAGAAERDAHMATLRDVVVTRYRTQPLFSR